jgi:hypothetical protein
MRGDTMKINTPYVEAPSEIQIQLLMLQSAGYEIRSHYSGNVICDESNDVIKYKPGYIELIGAHELPEIKKYSDEASIDIIKGEETTLITWKICDMKKSSYNWVDTSEYQSKGYLRMNMVKASLLNSLFVYIAKLQPPSKYKDIS